MQTLKAVATMRGCGYQHDSQLRSAYSPRASASRLFDFGVKLAAPNTVLCHPILHEQTN
jgi:hypothetical protein